MQVSASVSASTWLPGWGVLQQRTRILLITVHDRIGAHVGQRLDRERRVESAHCRVGRAADDEQVRHVPALPVLVHHRGLGIVAHARAALMVSHGSTRRQRRTPHLRTAHGAPDLLHLLVHELEARELIWPPEVVGQARRRQAPLILHVWIKKDDYLAEVSRDEFARRYGAFLGFLQRSIRLEQHAGAATRDVRVAYDVGPKWCRWQQMKGASTLPGRRIARCDLASV